MDSTWDRGTCRGCSTLAWRYRGLPRCPVCGTCGAPPSAAATSARSRHTGMPSSPPSAPSQSQRRCPQRRSSELGGAGRDGREGGRGGAGGPLRGRMAKAGVAVGVEAAIGALGPSGWSGVTAGANRGGQI
jgi:hypothetical protein